MHCKKILFKSILFVLILIFGVSFFTYSQKREETSSSDETGVRTTITYCNFNITEKWKLGNLSFNSLYTFSVNKKGEILDVKKIRDDFIGEEEVKGCISKWKLTGFPEESRFSVYFVWSHTKGWISQEISGNGFTQNMAMENIGVETIKTDLSKLEVSKLYLRPASDK